MRNPMRQSVRLAGARTRDDQERAGDLYRCGSGNAVLDRGSLGLVQISQMRRVIHTEAGSADQFHFCS